MAHLRNCILCGTQYDYCPHCDETRPTYFLKYCSENCKNISLVLNKFGFKHLTKDEAADELSKLNLSNLDKFEAKTQNKIKEIIKIEKPVEEVVVEATPEPVEEPIKIEKPAPKYRKPYNRKTK